jgi:hypothetical protein
VKLAKMEIELLTHYLYIRASGLTVTIVIVIVIKSVAAVIVLRPKKVSLNLRYY